MFSCKEYQNLNSFFAIIMGLSNIAVSKDNKLIFSTVISGKEGHGISLVRTESSVITKEQFVLIFLVYACTCFQNYYAF